MRQVPGHRPWFDLLAKQAWNGLPFVSQTRVGSSLPDSAHIFESGFQDRIYYRSKLE